MFQIEDHGSIALIRPMDDAAKEHAAEVYADAQWFGGAVVCEPRYVEDNLVLLADDGFEVVFA